MRRPVLALSLLALAACTATTQSPRPDEPAELVIHSSEGQLTLQVEVANTADERARGLMGRASLDPNGGMAFIFDRPVRGGFWMKDTTIPLSIAFWNERGRIVDMLDMQPCRADRCPLYTPKAEYVGAVEVVQGLLEARGVRVGDRVELMPNQ